VIELVHVQGDRERFLPILLEADESEPVVRSYMNTGRLFEVREHDGTTHDMVMFAMDLTSLRRSAHRA
jgi:hypothetical protein